MPSTLRVHAALLTVATLFSLNYIISKFGMRAFDPLTFAFLRIAGAAVILNLLPHDRSPLEPRDRRLLILFGLIGVALNQTMFLAGLSMTSAHVAAILMTATPVFTLGAAIGAGRERATGRKIAGIAVAAAGALLIVGAEGFAGSQRSLLGVLLIVGNSIAYALYLVISKPAMARLSARRVVARMFAIGTLFLLPVAAVPLAREHWSAIPARAWISVALVIAGPTVAAYLLNAWTLRHADSSLVASYIYVQPFLTAVLAALLLHEKIRENAAIAAALIFTGVWLAGRPAPPAATDIAVPGSPD